MKSNVMVLVLIAVLVFGLTNLSWAQCPEDSIDLGECDTLHVVPWDTAAPIVHVSFLVTHDSNTFYNEWEGMWMQDSISGFVIPLTWRSSNPVAACQLLPDSNTADLFGAGFGGSVFRDFGGLENRMRDMYEMGGGQEWDFRIIDVEYSYFRMSLIPTGEPDQGWWEGQRTLLATLTFMVDDTTTICIDSTFWPPTSRLRFARPDAHAYIPRHNMPVCFEVRHIIPGAFAWLNIRGYPDIAVAETLSYCIEYGNEYPAGELTQCSISVYIPPEVGYVSADPPGSVVDTTITWEIGTIAPGASGRITLDLTLNESVGTPDSTFEIHLRLTGYEEVGAKKEGRKGAFGVDFGIDIDEVFDCVDVVCGKEPDGIQFDVGANTYAVMVYNIGQVNTRGGFLVENISDRDWCIETVTCHHGTFTRIGKQWFKIWNHDQYLENRGRDGIPGSALIDRVTIYVKNEPRCGNKWIDNYMYTYNDDELDCPQKVLNNRYRQAHEILVPFDPNGMTVAPAGYVRPGFTLTYTVNFENEGSAPAESIRITSWIDTSLVEQTLLFNDTVGTYNGYTRMAIWDFPDINLQPDSSGYVSYRINVKEDLESGTEIKGNGMIYFDIMPGVPCSAFVTVDALTPFSQVDSVLRIGFPDTFQVYWSGDDPSPGASGIEVYSIYFSMDGDPDSLWYADTSWFEEDTLETSATFVGEPGRYYCFYSIAQDRVWWLQEPPLAPDACTPFLHGDANADWLIDIADVVFLINYLYRNGEAPNPVERGDANCNGEVTVGDIVFLISYLYKNGPPPPC